MASIPKRTSNFRAKNPITDDAHLIKLLDEAKTLDTDETFCGWKENFLEQYTAYLNPDGVENATNANGRLVTSLEKLAVTVAAVNCLVKEGKISIDTQSVQGTRRLTNMTEQMAITEKEVARFLPTTGVEENEVGYDKFELGAVMIDDGFQVYQHLKTTKDIVENLQTVVLDSILATNKLSIIQFYIRQIEIFCAVMADLSLFELMDHIVRIYTIRPRSKNKLHPEVVDNQQPSEVELPIAKPPSKPKKKEKVLDPNTKYTHYTAFTDGYFDPFSGTQPGREEFDDNDSGLDSSEGKGKLGNEAEFVVFFDMKTGRVGRIPRSSCRDMKLIVPDTNDGSEEQIKGEVDDPEEKDQLLWDMKKAIKSSRGQSSPNKLSKVSRTTPKTPKEETVSGHNSRPKNESLKKLAPLLDDYLTSPPSTPMKHAEEISQTFQSPRSPISETLDACSVVVQGTPQKRLPVSKVTKKSKPSTQGWSSPGVLASKRRGRDQP